MMIIMVDVCMCLNLKTIADICILLGSYVDWRKISGEFACQGHTSRSFFKASSFRGSW